MESSSIDTSLNGTVYAFLLPPQALKLSVEDYTSQYQILPPTGEYATHDADISNVTLTFASEGKESKSKNLATTKPYRPLYIHRIGRTAPSPSDEFFTLQNFQSIEALVCAFPNGVLFVPVSRSVYGAVVLKNDDEVLCSSVARASAFFSLTPGVSKRVDFVRLHENGEKMTVTVRFRGHLEQVGAQKCEKVPSVM